MKIKARVRIQHRTTYMGEPAWLITGLLPLETFPEGSDFRGRRFEVELSLDERVAAPREGPSATAKLSKATEAQDDVKPRIGATNTDNPWREIAAHGTKRRPRK